MHNRFVSPTAQVLQHWLTQLSTLSQAAVTELAIEDMVEPLRAQKRVAGVLEFGQWRTAGHLVHLHMTSNSQLA